MSKKFYQILLCENYYFSDENSSEFRDKPVCEIGSDSSEFEGKAYNVHCKRKIDGTKELSFNLPRYYIDNFTGERVQNELVNYLSNKVKLQYNTKNTDGEIVQFFFTINNVEEAEDDGKFIYKYVCSDVFIEELSKNGYGLSFTEEDGLGTIHELMERVVANTDWIYDQEATGTLYEYTTDISYNNSQGRYDTVYTPVPVHPITYIDELERYVYKLDVASSFSATGDTALRRVYCFDDTEIVSTNTVENLIYNNDDFTDTIGWTPIQDCFIDSYATATSATTGGTAYEYYMKVTSTGSTVKIFNDTAADANKMISSNQPYIFNYSTVENSATIKKIEIYKESPLSNEDATPIYTLNQSLLQDTDYVIKSKQIINNPYFVFTLDIASGASVSFSKFNFYEVKGKSTGTGAEAVTAETNNLSLLSSLTDKSILSAEDKLKMIAIEDTTISAYTHKFVHYFIRNNFYDDNGTDVRISGTSQADDDVIYLEFADVNINNITITPVDSFPSSPDASIIYQLNSDGKYYQYYSITVDGVTGSKWDYALFGSGANDKRRTLVVEKSNRFNIIQDLAELFKVWPVFSITRNTDNSLTKKISFKESALRENFSGFHAGVNLSKISRSIDSDEIVTKMYVEDQENDSATDGFITIRTASMNPWGENYLYNFQYYVNQNLLNTKYDANTLLIDHDKETLYLAIKDKNTTIYSNNEQLASLKATLSNLSSHKKALATYISSATERIASLSADNTSDSIGENDINLNNQSIEIYSTNKTKYEAELEQETEKYNSVYDEIAAINAENTTLQAEKVALISAFEIKYSQYIKEGTWSDNSYVENDTYYVDCLKVLDTSSMPKYTWSISAINGECIEELQDYKFEVGDKTFLVDNEFFGVTKNTVENYKFEVLISEIDENLDNPVETSYSVQNYLTSFEDLFQRISAATQTLELNEQTYDKGANFTADGEIDTDIIQKTLIQNSLILANADDNTYSLDNTGLFLQSILNPAKKLRVLAEGIFVSNSLNTDGTIKWTTGITPDGINASILTSGKVNTSKISIYSEDQENFTWNALGITAYGTKLEDGKDIVDNSKIVRLDKYGLYISNQGSSFGMETDGNGYLKPWFSSLSNENAFTQIFSKTSVSLTKYGFLLNSINGNASIKLGYNSIENTGLCGLWIKDTNGNITVSLQNNGENIIAGWKVTQAQFYDNSNSEQKAGINQYGTGQAFWAGGDETAGNNAPFHVNHSGYLVSTSGTIGGWSISENSLYANSGNFVLCSSPTGDRNGYALYINGKFFVKANGELTATGATIVGTITATSGSFTGAIHASSGDIDKVTCSNLTISSGKLNGYNISDFISSNGVYRIVANSGTIGGWNISPSLISATNGEKNAFISSDGEIYFNYQGKEAIGLGFYDLLSGGFTNWPCIFFQNHSVTGEVKFSYLFTSLQGGHIMLHFSDGRNIVNIATL